MENIKFISKKTNDVNFHYLKTKKYKTNLLVVNISYDLLPITATKIGLIPFILKMGSKKYPNAKLIQEKLDDMYGALLFVHIFKRGEKQIVQFSIEVANEKFLTDGTKLLTDAIKLMAEILIHPLIIDDGFREDIYRIEKEMLKQRVNGIIDNKMLYAEYQMIQHMCQNERYKLLEYGNVDDLDQMDHQELYQFYKEWLSSSPIDIFLVGDFSEDEVRKQIEDSFYITRGKTKELQPNQVEVEVKEEDEIIEELDIAQAKLDLGLRTKISIKDDLNSYVSLLLFNGVLGGFAHSKLFTNVREKASLAYYVFSKLDSHKGIMTIQSGIDSGKYHDALDIIKQQVYLIQEGNISEQEFNLTKKLYTSQLKELLDKPRMLVDYAYHFILSQKDTTLQDILTQIEKIKIADVVNISNKIKFDTIYLLRPKGEKTNG